jgi:hypothetical protein
MKKKAGMVTSADISGSLQAERTAVWITARRARDTRRESRALLVSTVAALLLQILLTIQFAVGALRRFSFSDTVVTTLLVTILLTVIGSLIAPVTVSRFLSFILRSFGEKFFTLFSNLVLSLFYVATMPVAYLWGRKVFISRHKQSGAWVEPKDWKVSTWSTKISEADAANRRSRSTALRALRIFAEQRNWFLVIAAALLLMFASFIAFANSPVVAPFIYTLF